MAFSFNHSQLFNDLLTELSTPMVDDLAMPAMWYAELGIPSIEHDLKASHYHVPSNYNKLMAVSECEDIHTIESPQSAATLMFSQRGRLDVNSDDEHTCLVSRIIGSGSTDQCNQYSDQYRLQGHDQQRRGGHFSSVLPYPPTTLNFNEINRKIGKGLEEPTLMKVGKYSIEERKEKITKYLNKRNQRNFNKTIKYACRKTLADKRVRVRGRFAKNNEDFVLVEEQEVARDNLTFENHLYGQEPTQNIYSSSLVQMKKDYVKEDEGEEDWLEKVMATLMYSPSNNMYTIIDG